VIRGWLRRAPILVGTLAVALAGCAKDAPQDTFKAEGPNAQDIKNLIIPVFGIAAVVFVFILGGCVYIALRYRARSEDDYDDMPKQIHGNISVELGWTIVPALILTFVAVFTVVGVFKLNEDPVPGALPVKVVGQQWWWEYHYDLDGDGRFDDIVTANDLVIPAGRQIALTITARDVIHSFWVPRLNGKRDAVPNREHPWKLQADHPGEYLGQCTEFCGLSHAEMRIKAIALPAAEFNTWVENQQRKAKTFAKDDQSLAAQGQRLFLGQLCSSCHLINGVDDKNFQTTAGENPGMIKDPKLQVSRHAPNLTHLMSRTTFAGAKFDLRKDTADCRKLGVTWADTDEGLAKCLNRADLEAWLRNPPKRKAMMADGFPGRSNRRGMPNLHLTEDQIDLLVTYLTTLK
jgi:cytochrome c oxidase subunit 2